MRISHSIVLSFGFIVILFTITTYNDYKLSEDIRANSEYLSRSTEVIRNAARFQRNILSMESGLRGYLLTDDESFIESYDSANIDNENILSEFAAVITHPRQKELLREISVLSAKWTSEYTEPLKLAKARSAVSIDSLPAFNQKYREKIMSGASEVTLRALLGKFRDFTSFEYKLRESRKRKLDELAHNTKIISYVLTVLSVLTAMVVVAFLVKHISRRIGQMTLFANSIAGGNYNATIPSSRNDELNELGHSLNHMADELSRNMTLLKRSNQELDQFAHIVSHDMKTPLRGIANIISWIEEDHKHELTPKVIDYIELIKGRIFRAENLIAGLLAYARIDKEAIEQEEVDLNQLIDEVRENVDNRNTVFTVFPLPTLYTERVLILQVFTNLISNGIKYNDKERKEIQISFDEHPDCFEFHVKDNGAGIAPNHHERIFTIFETLQDKDSFESTGVGLAIVSKILDTKKQKVKVSSRLGVGSVFSFTWPKS